MKKLMFSLSPSPTAFPSHTDTWTSVSNGQDPYSLMPKITKGGTFRGVA